MSQADSFERLMLDLINQERAKAGVDPLKLELRLNDSAEDYSEDMLEQDFFSHTGQDGSDPGDRMREAGFQFSGSWTWGENIAWQSERGATGIADDVANLHQGLMNSPGHRANILNPNFEVIGIGIERGNYNGWDAVMVTQNFARTGAPLQLDNGNGGGGGDPTPLPPQDLVLYGNGGANTLTGRTGDDRLFGQGGNDTLTGNEGADTLKAGSGSDQLRGGSGNDEADGGTGNDKLWGGNGSDNLLGRSGNDKFWGGNGSDRLWGGNGNDTIHGGNGNDTIYAGNDNDSIGGGADNDDLGGGNGNDTLNGGTGDDKLRGGAGADRLIFSTGDDRAFGFGGADVVDLSNVATIKNFADLQANHLSGGANAVINDGLGNTLTLVSVNVATLDAGDFIF
ncbi:CAP domain-containing protein [Ruegeria sp. 2012CJ41-6]|uniref:CAP domain-containing protein n=1 Tax=Ruegeria spongiae TaxID=2942209 RepID=A0ABT0Q5X4_9RHOB|nr:CAP domain-containing protein [Ruegeria spongiae]MCL6285243.1 CAP domain-containing protein [Ruegeria spongiae]